MSAPHRPARLMLLPAALALASATSVDPPPGEGVLCLGVFVYMTERAGAICHAGQDAAFQSRIGAHARSFDAYILRNTGGDPALLAKFKASQNIDSADPRFLCEGDVAAMYDRLRAEDSTKLDAAVDQLLARDGKPTFGDCV